ncbi:glycosyltransferase [bacterium]|nr:glycosyltransferase [bacterium]
MKILFLSDGSSVHTKRWVNATVEQGNVVHLFSLAPINADDYPAHDFTFTDFALQKRAGGLSKLKYLKVLPELKKIVREFKPDIMHAHFATSYGLLGSLCGFHPFVLSVWGSDVFDFPRKSFLHKALLKHNLKAADKILSTSNIMAVETKKYTDKEIEVTPFGINTEQFRPEKVRRADFTPFSEEDIVVGTIKWVEKIYGMEYLIRAFSIVSAKHPELPLKLLIVGDGSERQNLEALAKELGLGEKVHFAGRVDYSKVHCFNNVMDVYSALSLYDSFGVAIVEAESCGKPVVVSNVGGLPEVVENGKTGFVVEKQNAEAAAEKLEMLVLDPDLREKMGKAGRERVMKLYDWNENVAQMMKIYNKINVK